jgi:hypothetical protein
LQQLTFSACRMFSVLLSSLVASEEDLLWGLSW